MSKLDFIEQLGWKPKGYWANRKMYEITEHCTYMLFEHRGSIGLYYDGVFHYRDLKEDVIERLTKVFKEREEMMMHPKEFTLYQAQQNTREILDLITDLKISN